MTLTLKDFMTIVDQKWPSKGLLFHYKTSIFAKVGFQLYYTRFAAMSSGSGGTQQLMIARYNKIS